MRKQNRWAHGNTNLVLSALPDDLKGQTGCRFYRATFDPTLGEEVYLSFMDEGQYVREYGRVDPFNLFAHTGFARTPFGVIAYIVWQIAAGSPQEFFTEQYLNPHRIETIQLVSSAASQTHLKLIIIDNQTTEVGAFIDFENVFRLGDFVGAMSQIIGHEAEGDFDAAVDHVMRTTTLQDLVVRSTLGSPENG